MASLASIRKVYDTYAQYYDVIFGRLFHQGRNSTVELVNKRASPGAHVLELGVGTGLSLALYRPDLSIVGVDISEKMLKKAEEQVIMHKLQGKISLKVMDAARLDCLGNSFDFVVAMYVASVVPDINALLKEISRVVKPGGEILFVNHFSSEAPFMHFLEKKFAAITHVVGFNSDFSIRHILNDASFEVIEIKKVNLFKYWTLVHCKKK